MSETKSVAPPQKLIQRILCPVDFSTTSAKAFEYAAKLAHQLRAELLVLHAFDTPKTLDIAGQTRPADPALRTKLEALTAPCEHVVVKRILHAGAQVLAPGGRLLQFTYALRGSSPWQTAGLVSGGRERVLANLPPARIDVLERLGGG